MYDIGTGILILIKNKTDINIPIKIDKFEYLKKEIKKVLFFDLNFLQDKQGVCVLQYLDQFFLLQG
ncbi:hypothetical protein HNP92_001367 [Methanococcus maripaludis]|uniref:Uncharacterized protein n=1 Tax=Methanococcus maripaludis TaxID=39152 RepID=A0A7J9S5M9_METMI|nr:hypothetical protein [Methanococcus maripaludis]